MQDTTAPPVTVYWQPGCTSCLKTKEFLQQRDIPFLSVNVLEERAAIAELAGYGLRGVPVVAAGGKAIYSQSLRDVERFLGLAPMPGGRLPATELVQRLGRVLQLGCAYLHQLPDELLDTTYRNRDRTMRVLVHHIFRIAEALLESAQQGGRLTLTLESVVREAGADMADRQALQSYADSVRARWAAPGSAAAAFALCEGRLMTFYGEQDVHEVLERTTWHSMQHLRQLAALMADHGIAPCPPLTPDQLRGLPLPDQVWEDTLDALSAGAAR